MKALQQKIKNERGVALTIVLLVLIVLSLIVVSSYQSSILGLMVSDNLAVQPIALANADNCAQHGIRRVRDWKWTAYTINLIGTGITCQNNPAVIISQSFRNPGNSWSLAKSTIRFQTTATGKRSSRAQMITDVNVVQPVN